MEDNDSLIVNYINGNVFELPLVLDDYISYNDTKFKYRLEFYSLKVHVDNFLEDTPGERFLVLPGIRGVGKSTLLFQIYEYLLKEKKVPLNQILYVSCDDVNDFTDCHIRQIIEIFLRNYHDTSIRLLDKKIFLLIDESQYDNNWALSGKIIYDRTSNIFMIFSGSSALHLEYNADAARRSYSYEVRPVNFLQHIRLKYNLDIDYTPHLLKDMLISGNIDECVTKESENNGELMRNFKFNHLEWENYLFYGGYPIYFTEENNRRIRDKIVDMTNKVVNKDLPNIKNISEDNLTNANRILRYFALMDSSNISQNKLSNILGTAAGNVKTILDLLEKTHIIFALEAYGSASNRSRKPRKYYFATSSIKYSLSSFIGNTGNDKNKLEGILLENMVASKLYELSDYNQDFSLYYDGGKRSNVDFIISNDFNANIPVEVGRGKKDKRQVKNAMKHYDSSHGIIISDTTKRIEMEDDIIYIPSRTFALL